MERNFHMSQMIIDKSNKFINFRILNLIKKIKNKKNNKYYGLNKLKLMQIIYYI